MNLDFTQEDIKELFEDSAYFIVPTFIQFSKDKQFDHMRRSFEKYNIPFYKSPSSISYYDPLKGFYLKLMPNSIRKEFGIQAYDNIKAQYQTLYDPSSCKFANLTRIIP